MDMMTIQERIQAAWGTGDPLALHREVERLAAEGQSQQSLEDALEALLLTVRTAGASDATEEIINGMWDRLTGWCHADRYIQAASSGRFSEKILTWRFGKAPIVLKQADRRGDLLNGAPKYGCPRRDMLTGIGQANHFLAT